MFKLFACTVIVSGLLMQAGESHAQGLISERFYTIPGVNAEALAAHAFKPSVSDSLTAADLFDEAQRIVEANFFNPAGLKPFVDVLQAGRETAESVEAAGLVITQALRALRVSHTARYTPDQIEYYELIDIVRPQGLDGPRAAHDKRVAYEGVGMAARSIEGRTFVTHLYDGAAARRAGLQVGDEIVAVDGEAYHPIYSFRQRTGVAVTFRIRRHAGAETIDIDVTVEWIRPNEAFSHAIGDSVRVVERDGRRFGTIRLWTYGSNDMRGLLTRLISSQPLRSVDGLVLDLRSRWGGYGSEASDFFLSRTRDIVIVGPDGRERTLVARWHKPLVAIIDQGTRSSMEIVAYSLQQAGVPLIGSRTAGAVLTVRSFLLSDRSLLMLAVNDVRLDGKRLEGIGVPPDIDVPFDIRYANGADPQFDRALMELSRKLLN